MTKPELAQYAKEDGTGRAYKHPFRLLPNNKPLVSPSVTTILGLVNKEALIQWAVNQTVAWAVDNVSLLYTKERESAIKSGKYRYMDVRDERAEVGTGIHETIEAEHTGSWNFPPLDEEQRQIMAQWRKLQERYVITAHRSEFTVWSLDEQFNWAGTGDGLWDILDTQTGTFYENMTIDLKTSKNMWPEHWLQLSALYHSDVIMVKQADGTWREEPMVKGDGTAIIHLRADKAEIHFETDQELLDIQYLEFQAYRQVWEHKKSRELYVKNREKTLALAF